MERRRIVEETLESVTSVARVATKYGVNANQVFQWRRLYSDCKLGASPSSEMALLPVSVVADHAAPKVGTEDVIPKHSGAVHIELLGKIRISLEGEVDPAVIRAVLKRLPS